MILYINDPGIWAILCIVYKVLIPYKEDFWFFSDYFLRILLGDKAVSRYLILKIRILNFQILLATSQTVEGVGMCQIIDDIDDYYQPTL